MMKIRHTIVFYSRFRTLLIDSPKAIWPLWTFGTIQGPYGVSMQSTWSEKPIWIWRFTLHPWLLWTMLLTWWYVLDVVILKRDWLGIFKGYYLSSFEKELPHSTPFLVIILIWRGCNQGNLQFFKVWFDSFRTMNSLWVGPQGFACKGRWRNYEVGGGISVRKFWIVFFYLKKVLTSRDLLKQSTAMLDMHMHMWFIQSTTPGRVFRAPHSTVSLIQSFMKSCSVYYTTMDGTLIV